MSYQVLRIEKFSKGDLGKIGAETERTAKRHRNEDIDRERTPFKSIYKRTQFKQPKICSSEFWEQRGAQTSFGNLQDEFYQQVACYYGLERGEVGSSKKHTTKYQWQKQQQEKELIEKTVALTQATAQIEEADKMLQDKRYRLTAVEVELYGTEREKRIAEEQRAKAEEETRELTSQKEKLCKEIAPLSAAAEAFTKASGKKPDKKQIPALVAENARLAKELEYSIKDQTGLFSELQKAERENASLKKDAQTYRTIREHAPDKLLEAMDEAKRRKESKLTPFRGNSSSWTK